MKLTNRDKKLLYLLATIVILFVFAYFIILPQWTKHEELTDQLAEKNKQVETMQTAIGGIGASETLLAEGKKQFDTVTADFYPMMESYALERMVTQIALDNGLTAQDFLISTKPEESKLTPYFASMLALEMGITNTQEDGTEGQNSAPEEIVQTVIYSSKITVKVMGSRENMEKMIDQFYANYPAIRVTDYNISDEKALNQENQSVEASKLTLGLEIYMCNK